MPRRSRTPTRTMPAQTRHLYTHGHLTPDDARALGVRVMQCATCHAEVHLVCTFPPVPEDEIETRKLPPLRWGEEVLVVLARAVGIPTASMAQRLRRCRLRLEAAVREKTTP